MTKCAFAQERVAYLGHVISGDGVATDESKIQSIRQWPTSKTLKELQAFLVLTNVTEDAFQVLKTALVTAPVLALPDFSQQFMIDTDVCDVGIGAVLPQNGHPLEFVSRALGPKNRSLSVYEKEYLAILLAVQQWRAYLQMGEFIIRTDHKSLYHLTYQRLHTEWQQKALTKMMGM